MSHRQDLNFEGSKQSISGLPLSFRWQFENYIAKREVCSYERCLQSFEKPLRTDLKQSY